MMHYGIDDDIVVVCKAPSGDDDSHLVKDLRSTDRLVGFPYGKTYNDVVVPFISSGYGSLVLPFVDFN